MQYNSPVNYLKDDAEDGPLPWADDQAEPLTAEQIARATDAMNFALAAFGIPDEYRGFIDALIGASGGCMDWFEAADIEVGQRARLVSTLVLKDKSIEKWTQRRRDEFIEWQQARKITLVEAQPGGWKDGVKFKSKYRVAGVFKVAIATDRRARAKPGFDRNPKRELRKAAAAVYSEFRAEEQGQARQNRFRKGRRTTDTFRKLISTYLDDLCGAALIERRDLPQILEDIELDVYQRRLKCSNSPPLPNRVQAQQIQTDSIGAMVDNLSTYQTGVKDAGNGAVHTSLKQEYGQPPVGQEMADFLSETFPSELDVDGVDQAATRPNWRDQPVTIRQRDLLIKGKVINIPTTRGAASDRIAEVLESGALSSFFSLEELESYDPKAGGRNRKERRFCCPQCGDDKPQDDDHRSLSLNTYTGAYHCHRCGASGALRDHLGDAGQARVFDHTGPQEPEKKSDKWRERWNRAKPVRGTPGQKYLEGRGVPIEIAIAAGVRYGEWWKRGKDGKPEAFNAVLFPVFDQDGNLVAVIARGIVGKVMRTAGDLKLGVFRATPDALGASRLAVCESPIDSLILAAVGVDSIALGGTAIPEWLPGALNGKDVMNATDADGDGDRCAAKLASLSPTSWRLRPVGAKDWGEIAEWGGLEAVDECVMDAMSRADDPEVEL